jgi:hypothetical protein
MVDFSVTYINGVTFEQGVTPYDGISFNFTYTPPVLLGSILLEAGDYLLLEDGGKILSEVQ